MSFEQVKRQKKGSDPHLTPKLSMRRSMFLLHLYVSTPSLCFYSISMFLLHLYVSTPSLRFYSISMFLLHLYVSTPSLCFYSISMPPMPSLPLYLHISNTKNLVDRVVQLVQRLTTGWTVRDRIPVGTRFFARPDRSWGPPSLL